MQWPTLRATALVAPALLLLCVAAPTTFADDVFLKNGQTFTDVVVEQSAGRITIHLREGRLTLSAAQVDRIESKPSPYQEFLQRRSALLEQKADAGAWIGLADWALRNDLRPSAREAALAAATLDPRAPGLDRVMAPFDLVWNETGARWESRDEQMRRNGFVRSSEGWKTREEHARLETERARANRDRLARRQAYEQELAELQELEHLRRLRRAREQEETAAPTGPQVQVNVLVPGFFFPTPVIVGPTPAPPSPTPAGGTPPPPRGPLLDAFERQPGSLIPGVLDLDRGSR